MLNNCGRNTSNASILPKNLNDLFVDWMNGVESAKALGLQRDRDDTRRRIYSPIIAAWVSDRN